MDPMTNGGKEYIYDSQNSQPISIPIILWNDESSEISIRMFGWLFRLVFVPFLSLKWWRGSLRYMFRFSVYLYTGTTMFGPDFVSLPGFEWWFFFVLWNSTSWWSDIDDTGACFKEIINIDIMIYYWTTKNQWQNTLDIYMPFGHHQEMISLLQIYFYILLLIWLTVLFQIFLDLMDGGV